MNKEKIQKIWNCIKRIIEIIIGFICGSEISTILPF